jgi:3-oxoacyl-[acyl-carrier-protein] synthase-3
LAIDSGAATLRAAAIDPLSIDALVLCCTGTPGPPETHGRFVSTVITGLGLGDVAFYGLGLNRCVGLLAGVDLADALVVRGRYRRVLVVTVDRAAAEADRMATYALFSDGAASCVVAAVAEGRDRFELVACAGAQQTASLDWTSEISADLARRVNDLILTSLGMKVGDLSGLMHSNIYKPLVVMKERQAGFAMDQLFLDNITRVGHCYSADPLINLVDRGDAGHVQPDHYYLLAASIPGSRMGVLVRRLAD